VLSFLICVLAYGLAAQDLHFSQFYNNYHLLNPAALGLDNTEFKAGLNHRVQWPEIIEPITTSALYADRPIYYKQRIYHVGFMLSQDQFAGFNFQSTSAQLSANTQLIWGKNQFRVGLQAGLVSRQVDMSRLSFPNQWQYDQGVYNTAIQNGELSQVEATAYADLNLGITWQRNFKNIRASSGIATRHVNHPNISFYDNNSSRLTPTAVFFARVELPASPLFSFIPMINYQHTTGVNQLLAGNQFHFSLAQKRYEFNVGVFYRSGFNRNRDAVISSAGIGYKSFYIEVSNDFNISKLSAMGDTKSTFELALIYRLQQLKSPLNLVPCERL